MSMPGVPVIDEKGRKWPSISAFARHKKVTPQTVQGHLDRNGHVLRLGSKNFGSKAPNGKPRTYFGITFDSKLKAAKFFGIGFSTLTRSERNGFHPKTWAKMKQKAMEYHERRLIEQMTQSVTKQGRKGKK